jgi:molybdopterin-guanine dinucleotide biosynthesis protein A
MEIPVTAAPVPVVAVILAGGRGRRMGHVDKAMLTLAGKPLVMHVLARLAPQVAAVAISANGDPARFAAIPAPVLPDAPGGPEGPLAGLLAGARWAVGMHPGALLLSAPCDVPFLPADLVARLRAAPLPVCAASAGRLHPLVALWRPGEVIERASAGGSARALLAALGGGSVAWDLHSDLHHDLHHDHHGDRCMDADPFTNLNDPAALAAAARSMGGA